MADPKLQIAIYWGAACGGCDVAVLDTDEFLLEIAALADIRLWPLATDGKYADVEALPDGGLDLTLFNGAVRNSENERLARLLRAKSRILVAFGSCAHMGGIPGLANLVTKEEILERVYLHNPSIEAGNRTVPLVRTQTRGPDLALPQLYERVYKLDDIVPVDYYVPGCPPAPEQVKAVVRAIAGGFLPPKGSVLGAAERALCDDCPRARNERKIKRFFRPWEIHADPELCLLEQGILCAGPVTRSGCGVRCPNSGMPCRGCYGPPPKVADQGAKFISAVASIVDSKDPEEVDRILEGIPDIMSYAYRFSLAGSLLQRRFR